MTMAEKVHGNNGTKGKQRMFPREMVMMIFNDWFKATASNYPPNLYEIVEWKRGKQVRRDHNEVVGIVREDYIKYKAADAKFSTILFEFVPMGNRKANFQEDGEYLLKIK